MDAQIAMRPTTRMFSSYLAQDLEDLLEVSAGFRAAQPDDHAMAYQPRAAVPREPWRRLRPGELSRLFELSHEWERHRSVAILKPLPAVSQLLDNERLATRPRRTLEKTGLAMMAQTLIEGLAEECDVAPDYLFLGCAVNDPDMPTVSINKKYGKLVGLHVDYWDGLPLRERRNAGNRISINVGPTTRYILFAPADLEEMAAKLAEERGIEADLPALPDLFMREFADFPVVRCRLPPGAAYVVPTENMLHDGSTAGGTAESRSLVFRGHIRPRYTRLLD